MDIKIVVATHKQYDMPTDSMYIPLQVGAAGKPSLGYERDDVGDNISDKNPYYCELTGLYYAWKNLNYDYLGLVHYRRRFGKSRDCLMTSREASDILSKYDLIIPTKRRYYVESLYSHYNHTLEGGHLDVAREIIERDYPQYAPYIDMVYNRRWGYMFNMFVLSADDVDDYCQWLFNILSQIEGLIDMSGMSDFELRLYGRISEILFNIWLAHRVDGGARPYEYPVCSMEPVNWIKKGSAFLAAKFFGKKYKESF